MAHEAFHFLNHKSRGNRIDVAFKVDLNKAYDIVEWDFFLVVIKKMGFSQKNHRFDMAIQLRYRTQYLSMGYPFIIFIPKEV